MTIEIKVGGLAHGGAFVGAITQGEFQGKKAFVRLAAPGELVEGRVTKAEPNLVRAELVSIRSPSQDRVEPPCPKFGQCGGCDLQHLTVSAQRVAKQEMVISMLKKQGDLSPAEGIEFLGQELGGFDYRQRVYFHLNRSGEIGLYRQGTGDVVPLDRCFIARPAINEALTALKPHTAKLGEVLAGVMIEEHHGDVFLVWRVREDADFAQVEGNFAPIPKLFRNVLVTQRHKVLFSQPAAGRVTTAGHFSQVNEAANKILVDTVLTHAQGGAVTDFYAGSGNFSLPLGRKGLNVCAVEADPILVQHGNKCARDEKLPVTFFPMRVEEFLKRHRAAATVVLDPPRAGAKEVAERLTPDETHEIVYVSCNVPTLIRDLKTLRGRGFDLRRIFLLDMFPQTHHVETICILRAVE